MNLDLKNKSALVCGSTQGIGWASALELASMGAQVILMGRNEAALKEKVSQLPNVGHQMHDFLVADFEITDQASVVLKKYLETGKKIQILINNTGGPTGGQILEEESEKFRKVFDMHLINNHQLAQLLVPCMQEAGFGRIVNIISLSVKQPIVGLGVSNTIRWAVASWAKTLSREVGLHGITVNNVLPGYTKTARLVNVNKMRAQNASVSVEEIEAMQLKEIPTQKYATAEEVAAAVAFLCAPAAASINGINLPVDGGLSQSL